MPRSIHHEPSADLPRIAVTMGDPAGIGPEICVKALVDEQVRNRCRAVVVGNLRSLNAMATKLGIDIAFTDASSNTDSHSIAVYDPENGDSEYPVGVDSANSGRASARYIERAVELWRAGEIDAIATAPISKKALSMAGYEFPGHTEFLAHLTNTKKVAMSFFAGDLRVVLLSTHIALRDAIENVTKVNIVDLITFSSGELQKLLGRKPKLAVAGLNPHASEGGMFGGEETREIVPAIEECRRVYGIDISGPYSPDTIFIRGHRGEFDAVIALYHDQATIAVKSLSFGSAVNVTLGLPLIRTSVDHGTAFDIAGKGIADASSLITAIKLAAELVQPRTA